MSRENINWSEEGNPGSNQNSSNSNGHRKPIHSRNGSKEASDSGSKTIVDVYYENLDSTLGNFEESLEEAERFIGQNQ